MAVEPFSFNADGSFPTLKMTREGPPAIRALDPYVITEGETIAWGAGVETEACTEGGLNVTSIDQGDSIKLKDVDFGAGAVSFEARVASASSGGVIELHLDSLASPAKSSCAVRGSGGWQSWVTTSCAVTGLAGRHDLYLKFTGGSGPLFNLNWWRFVPREPSADAGTDGPRPSDGGSPRTDPKDGGWLDGGIAADDAGTSGGDGGGAGGDDASENEGGVTGFSCQSGGGPHEFVLGLLGALLVSARRRRSRRAPYAE